MVIHYEEALYQVYAPLSLPFPGGPALASSGMSPFWILLELKMMEVVVTTGATRRAKLQSNRCHQHQHF